MYAKKNINLNKLNMIPRKLSAKKYVENPHSSFEG
jgi:hypothetical protein